MPGGHAQKSMFKQYYPLPFQSGDVSIIPRIIVMDFGLIMSKTTFSIPWQRTAMGHKPGSLLIHPQLCALPIPQHPISQQGTLLPHGLQNAFGLGQSFPANALSSKSTTHQHVAVAGNLRLLSGGA